MLETVQIAARWIIECHGADGALKWREDYHNLVVTAGRNALLDNTFNAAAGSVSWYVALVTGPGSGNTYAAADTMGSHGGWTESTAYSESTRQAWTKNGASSSGAMSNSSSKAVFSINGTATLAGAFMTSNNTKSGTTGTLFGVGNFGADRSVISGDSLSVQVDPSLTAS